MKFKAILILLSTVTICHADWLIFQPIRKYNNKNPIISDVASHTKDVYSDSDHATVSHETCHGINNDLRNRFHGSYNCFYLMGNLGYRVKEVKTINLNDVAKAIPEKYRGGIYQLYLVSQQRWWKNEPSYLLDEQTAYTAGTGAALVEGNDFRADDSGFRMLEMMVYCNYLKKLANQKDISEVVDYQNKTCIRIYKNFLPKKNEKVIQNYKNLLEVMGEENVINRR
jgi:hypothetical protein